MQEMLRGVVTRGNAKKINYLKEQYNLDIGGKTGTTNDYKDAWFIGFIRFPSQKTWIVGTFVGFSAPKTLGAGEGGRSVAIPIFESFISSLSNLRE
jgi:penicillin-binding protein 1A